MKPLHVQHFMPNRAVRKVPVSRCEEFNTVGVNDNCEFALTSSSAFILFGVQNYFDINPGAFLHFQDELLDGLAEAGKIFGLHMTATRNV